MTQLHCKRCGYVWEPRQSKREVTICPRCKSRYWNQAPDRYPDFDNMKKVLNAFDIAYEQWNCTPADDMDPDNPYYDIYNNTRYAIQTGIAVWELFDKNYRYLGHKAIMHYQAVPLQQRLKELVAIHKKKSLNDKQIDEITKDPSIKKGIK